MRGSRGATTPVEANERREVCRREEAFGQNAVGRRGGEARVRKARRMLAGRNREAGRSSRDWNVAGRGVGLQGG